MCLLDTTDGALMMTLYTSTNLARDPIAILYYSIVLSGITVLVAVCIGIIQLLSLIANFCTGSFWDGVNVVGDHFDVIGGGICGAFIIFGVLSVILYKPWRRKFGRHQGGVMSLDNTADCMIDNDRIETVKPVKDLESGKLPTEVHELHIDERDRVVGRTD